MPQPSKNHRLTRRDLHHDYRRAGHYLLTLTALDRRHIFGTLDLNRPYVIQSEFGRRIFHEERPKISLVWPQIKVWRTCIMPDHLHLIVHVTRDLPEGKHLGHMVRGFKSGCLQLWRKITGSATDTVFEENYNDRYVRRVGHLNAWKQYLEDNPRRLWIKRQHAELFTTLYDKKVLDTRCQVFGNLFLLDRPGKEAVIVHRRDSDEEYRKNFDKWMKCGEAGGTLVGAFISQREKAVLHEALDRGYDVIELCEHGFNRMYKPTGIKFDACANGQLLQVCPYESQYRYGKITREGCLALNALATEIAARM